MVGYPKEVARETGVVTLGYNSFFTLFELGLLSLESRELSKPAAV